MRWIVVILLAIHGLLHFMGFAKAFALAGLPRLTQQISRGVGVLWCAAGLLILASAVTSVVWPRVFWIVGAMALVLSQAAILSAWKEAWAGTAVNMVLLLAVAHGFLTEGPWSFRTQFERDAIAAFGEPIETRLVTPADLAALPEPIQRYLRAAGVVGQPRVRNYRLRFRGRIRSAPDARWMPFEAYQQSFADHPTRLFLMRARMFALPVEAFHRLTDGRATMRVTAAGAIPLADASGNEMDRSETVTLFNDMCILAPATLLDPAIAWGEVNGQSVQARFTNGRHSISAVLFFGEEGLLTNFSSEDRSRASADGKSFTRLRFSTPVRDYRHFGSARLAAHGEARWTLRDGEFTYGEFDLQDIAYNVRP